MSVTPWLSNFDQQPTSPTLIIWTFGFVGTRIDALLDVSTFQIWGKKGATKIAFQVVSQSHKSCILDSIYVS